MKKRLVKIATVVGIMTVMMMSFAGCKKTECYWCNEMKYCEPFEASLLGELNLCKDCKKLVEPISDNLKGLEAPQ